MSDEDVGARVGYHLHAAHIDLREHGVLLLHEEMDDTKKNDGIENAVDKKRTHVARRHLLVDKSHGPCICNPR